MERADFIALEGAHGGHWIWRMGLRYGEFHTINFEAYIFIYIYIYMRMGSKKKLSAKWMAASPVAQLNKNGGIGLSWRSFAHGCQLNYACVKFILDRMQLVSKGSVGHHKAPDSWACNHLSTGISWYFWTFALVAAELVREFTSADRSGQPLIQTLLACRCEPPLLSFGCHSGTCISKPPKHCRVAVSAILQQRWNIKRQHIHKRAGKKHTRRMTWLHIQQ